MVDRVDSRNPWRLQPSSPGYYRGQADYFQKSLPEYGSSFAYDAVIAAGMGACVGILVGGVREKIVALGSCAPVPVHFTAMCTRWFRYYS
jgi:hypothetical protein